MITETLNYLTVNRGLSERTAESYSKALHSFARFINLCYAGTSWRTVTKQMIDLYVVSLVHQEYKAATIKQHVSALRTFYKTQMAMGTLNDNPARYVSTPKLGEKQPNTIEPEAIKRCLESQYTNETAKAVIAVLFETGVRLQELIDMRAEDINSTNQSIKVHGKGRKERTVYYGELTKQYGRKLHIQNMSQREIRRLVWEALRPFSKAPQLSPHAIRHTFACQLMNNGMPLEAISKLLGHEHTATTEIYAQLSNSKAKEYYYNYRPQLN